MPLALGSWPATAMVGYFFDWFNIKVFVKITNLPLHGKQFYSLMKFSACEIRSLGLINSSHKKQFLLDFPFAYK